MTRLIALMAAGTAFTALAKTETGTDRILNEVSAIFWFSCWAVWLGVLLVRACGLMYGRLQGCVCGHPRQLHREPRPAACLRCGCAGFDRQNPLPPQALTRGQGNRRARVNRRGLDASSQDGSL